MAELSFSEYVEKIANYFLHLPEGVVEVEKIVAKENKEKFIEIVKSFIGTFDKYHKFCLEFNSDYTKIKKFKI